MKLRSTLLTFVSVLLIGSLAGAATAPQAGTPAAPASPAPAAVASPVLASPLCLENVSKAELPAANPIVQKSTSICGTCSDVWCQGQTLGALCRTGSRCQNLYGNFCSQDGLSQCTCYSGQLP